MVPARHVHHRPQRQHDGHRDQEGQEPPPVTGAEVPRRAPPPVRPAPRREDHEPRAKEESERGAGSESQRGQVEMVGVVPSEAEDAEGTERERKQDEPAATEPSRAARGRGLAGGQPEHEERQQQRGESDKRRGLRDVARPAEREEAAPASRLHERQEVRVVPGGLGEVPLVPELPVHDPVGPRERAEDRAHDRPADQDRDDVAPHFPVPPAEQTEAERHREETQSEDDRVVPGREALDRERPESHGEPSSLLALEPSNPGDDRDRYRRGRQHVEFEVVLREVGRQAKHRAGQPGRHPRARQLVSRPRHGDAVHRPEQEHEQVVGEDGVPGDPAREAEQRGHEKDLPEGIAQAVRVEGVGVEEEARRVEQSAGGGRHDPREEGRVVVVGPGARGRPDERPRRDDDARDVARVGEKDQVPPGPSWRRFPFQRRGRTQRSGH